MIIAAPKDNPIKPSHFVVVTLYIKINFIKLFILIGGCSDNHWWLLERLDYLKYMI